MACFFRSLFLPEIFGFLEAEAYDSLGLTIQLDFDVFAETATSVHDCDILFCEI